MIDPHALLYMVALVIVPLHWGSVPLPIPYWAVLLAVVPGLWIVIGGSVLTIDRLLQLFEA